MVVLALGKSRIDEKIIKLDRRMLEAIGETILRLPYWMQKHRMLEEPPSYRVLGVPMQRCPGRIESARGQR